MKMSIIKTLLIVPIFMLFAAGSCDRTNIKEAGTIESDSVVFETGKEYVLRLKVPEELEGKVYKAMWHLSPDSAGKLDYKENKIISRETIFFKGDRRAIFIPGKQGKITVEIYMLYYRQTSPQIFAKKEFIVKN